MSSTALNQVYKYGIIAVEEAAITADVDIGDTTVAIAANTMSATPFTVGREYVLTDNTFVIVNAEQVPNAEWVRIASISETATPKTDGVGFTYVATLTLDAEVVGAYTMSASGSILNPGMEMAIQSSDFDCRFKTLTDAPKVDFDDESSRFATGDEGRDLSIAGARSGSIDFTQKMAWAGAVDTMPKWSKIIRTMGHVVKKYTSKGIGFLPSTWGNEVTATIWILSPENGTNPTCTVYRYRGCHGGNASSISVGKIGDPWMITAKYMGAFVGTTELPFASARVLTSPETNVPEVMLSNVVTLPAIYGKAVVASTYTTLTLLIAGENLAIGARFYSVDGSDTTDSSLTQAKSDPLAIGDAFTVFNSAAATYVSNAKCMKISQFTLDFGGIVNPFINQETTTGNAFFATQDRDPKLTCNPYMLKKSDDDIDFIVSNQITGACKITSALTSPHITIEIPNAQLLSPAYASREGYINTNRNYRCLRNDIGLGSNDSGLSAGIMYEIRIGERQ